MTKPIVLTPNEQAILDKLTASKGEIVTRATLREVIGAAGIAESNVVDVHIKNLRRKLEPERIEIETVRGFGYRMN